MYPIKRRNRTYQKIQTPQSDAQGRHCVALKEQGAKHNTFSTKESTESSGLLKVEEKQARH